MRCIAAQEMPASVGFTTGTGIGPSNDPIFNVHNLYQFSEDMVYTRGSHSMKYGADFQKLVSDYQKLHEDIAKQFNWVQ